MLLLIIRLLLALQQNRTTWVCRRVTQSSRILTVPQGSPHLTKNKTSPQLQKSSIPPQCFQTLLLWSYARASGERSPTWYVARYNQAGHPMINMCPSWSHFYHALVERITSSEWNFLYSLGDIGNKSVITYELKGSKSIRAGMRPHLTLTVYDFIKDKPKSCSNLNTQQILQQVWQTNGNYYIWIFLCTGIAQLLTGVATPSPTHMAWMFPAQAPLSPTDF